MSDSHNTFLPTRTLSDNLSVSSRPSRVHYKPCWVSLSAAGAAGPADSPGSPTASPPGYTGSSPSPVQSTHLSRSAWREAAATGSPEWPSPPRGPAWSPCPPAGRGGSGRTGRPSWRGPRGRSSAPQRRRRGCPSGSERACGVWPGSSQLWPAACPTAELKRRDSQRCNVHAALHHRLEMH